ncbi:hypothetical protein ATO11_03255 [Pseudaestuariivita atlantica]|uniref:PAS domain-containing protein n=2 Tax=Pseudaestuariivita atlantica TaxID=1317121 RepID=A0A0L1JVD3_9RHOB|nr:hypothetical protein ATO11_03255 [Pseudaestuariivita atlantica]
MTRFERSANSPAMRQVEAYWAALRDGRQVPDRADIDPRGLEAALDVTFIAERIAPGVARMRIAGFHFSDLLGMEARGISLNALFLPETRTQISHAVDQCCDWPAQVSLALRAPGAMGQPELQGNLLLLPLRSDLGDISRILGVIGVPGQIGRAPRRFAIENITAQPLSGTAPALPEGAPDRQQADGFAESQATFDAQKDDPRLRPSRVPHLRVVDGE